MSTEERRKEDAKIFQRRGQFRFLHLWGSVIHLFSLVVLFVFAVTQYPQETSFEAKQRVRKSRQEVVQMRRDLLELLDRIVRYQKYYKQIYGQYTRDIKRLGLPQKFFSGDWKRLHERYEISVADIGPSKLLVLAIAASDRVGDADIQHDRIVMDERLRVNANFQIPALSRSYLLEEVNRRLRLFAFGMQSLPGLADSYWRITRSTIEAKKSAIGLQAPVRGERVVLPAKQRSVASIFVETTKRIRSIKWEDKAISPQNKVAADLHQIKSLLFKARFAQHVYRQETGRYARRWQDLDRFNGFGFRTIASQLNNVKLQPLEADTKTFMVSLKGTSGNLLGEIFSINEKGTLKQIRFSKQLIDQLQQSTEWLEKNL